MSRTRTHGWLAMAGWLALFLAAASIMLLPAGWPAVVLAGLATLGLAADRRLGWLPAGLLVAIALPYGRGADVTPWAVAGYPVRPPDLAIALAVAGAVAALVRDRARIRVRLLVPGATAFVVASVVLLLVGAVALLAGTLGDFAMRDVLRDARWWAFYAAAPLAVLGGTSRATLARGLLWGATALAIVVVATAVGPVIEGGLKFSALTYDRGTLRMQFGNSIFLVPAVGYATWALLRHPARWRAGWLALLFSAQVLTLTRTSLLVTIIVVLLMFAAHALGGRRRRRWSMPSWRASTVVALALVVGFVGGIGLSRLGTPRHWTVAGSSSSSEPEDPFDRITFGDEQSNITVIIGSVASGGRFATYLNAMRVISDAPLLGNGFGQLVDVRFAYNQSRAYTIGKQPGVDNAYLTVALKAGAVGVAAIGALLLLPLVAVARRMRRIPGWFVGGWLGVLALTVTQSFAVGGYGPFGVALLAALPFIGYARTSRAAATSQR